MSSSPPKPQVAAPVAQASGADSARIAEEAKRRQAKGYSLANTLLAPNPGASQVMPVATKQTLG